jgi:hypothetical protein
LSVCAQSKKTTPGPNITKSPKHKLSDTPSEFPALPKNILGLSYNILDLPKNILGLPYNILDLPKNILRLSYNILDLCSPILSFIRCTGSPTSSRPWGLVSGQHLGQVAGELGAEFFHAGSLLFIG